MEQSTDRRPYGTRRHPLWPDRRWLPGLAAVALILATPLLGGAPTASASAAVAEGTSSTAGLPVPFPGNASDLFGVTCAPSSNCWAVGDYGSISGGSGVVVNLALHWDGTIWTQVSTPDPGGLNNNDANFLDTVRCTSATNCWAAGNVSAGGGPT